MRSLCNDIPMHIAKMVEARSGSQHRRQSLPLSHSCLQVASDLNDGDGSDGRAGGGREGERDEH